MVPVPEEHVEEAMRTILHLAARSRQRSWDEESVHQVFHQVDEASRAVLSRVARASVGQKQISDVAAAEAIEVSQREVLGIVREINARGQDDGFGPLVAVVETEERLPNGRTRVQRLLVIEPDVAEHLREAERRDLAATPHPLLGDQG